jgi:hypothetical protein
LSITIPLVPPRVLGDFTQLDVGAPAQVGVVNEVVMVEFSRNPSLDPNRKTFGLLLYSGQRELLQSGLG